MYIFNKKRFFSILISPLLFNGFLFGMESDNENNANVNVYDFAHELLLYRHEENAKTILEKLGLTEDDYEFVGFGTYSYVLRRKKDNVIYKCTYSNVKNNTDCQRTENFHSRRTSFKLKGKKIPHVCNIIDFKNIKKVKGKTKYNGSDPYQKYDLLVIADYVEGKTLDKYILQRNDKENKYTISELYYLVYRMCDVLKKFRDNGLIYSDVKEENIMIDEKTNDFVVIDVDSATTPKVTRKNSIEGATEGEKANMDLIALMDMALRIVCGNKTNGRSQFDLLDFEENETKYIVNKIEDIRKKIKEGKINSPDALRDALLEALLSPDV